MPTSSKDRRGFTEEEYKRELELHHIKLEKGHVASNIYRSQSDVVKEDPKSSVFRDFAEYGVHPARVVVQELVLSIPFLLSSLTAQQLELEVANLREKNTVSTISFRRPTVDEAYELISILNKTKDHMIPSWTPALKQYMTAANLFLFRVGSSDKIPQQLLTPSREMAMHDLTPLITRKIAVRELEERTLNDPGHWGSLAPESASLEDIHYLVGELMTNTAYTTAMREIVEWYKQAFRLTRIGEAINRLVKDHQKLLTTLRIQSSLSSMASGR